MSTSTSHDAVVIGGGFYGAVIALYLVRKRGFQRVCLLEQEADLLQRASYNNQARVHNGYHYPRSFTTAYRSRINLPKFVREWPQVVESDFIKLYAIARRNSKVTSRQFQRFCRETGAWLERAAPKLQSLFEPRLIEDVLSFRSMRSTLSDSAPGHAANCLKQESKSVCILAPNRSSALATMAWLSSRAKPTAIPIS
ncbi:FAD-dependent oxidoreductase [Paraburkholderia sp. RL18-085-BIA-A]|uniref:FAD-dependent oxidoreductase n=1 Tax=Paraburkholderia sp. RL18-085-BIA-A TaxID=3031633 RepID=UPI0038BAC7D6